MAAVETDSASHPQDHAPQVRWLPIALITTAAYAASMSALEYSCRAAGVKATASDSLELWSFHRSRVSSDNPKLLVAIGTSRIRAAILPGAVPERLPGYRLIQLGVNGPHSPIGTLSDLRSVRNFRGIVLCDVLPPLLDKTHWDDQALYYKAAFRRAVEWSAFMHSSLQANLPSLSPSVSLRASLAGAPDRNRLIEHACYTIHADRSMTFEYASADDLSRIRDGKLAEYTRLCQEQGALTDANRLRADLVELSGIITELRANGATVVFLRLPSAGSRLALEERYFPSAKYLELLARLTSASCIDFRDLQNARAFKCPDESHLSTESARAYTASLCAELRRRGYVTPDSE